MQGRGLLKQCAQQPLTRTHPSSKSKATQGGPPGLLRSPTANQSGGCNPARSLQAPPSSNFTRNLPYNQVQHAKYANEKSEQAFTRIAHRLTDTVRQSPALLSCDAELTPTHLKLHRASTWRKAAMAMQHIYAVLTGRPQTT